MPNETAIRLGFFFGILALVALWETILPRRQRSAPRGIRWVNNLSIVVLDTVLVRLAFPAAAVGAAVIARKSGGGLLPSLAWPLSLEIVATVLALDLIIYLQHVLFHFLPFLWRFHRMHHADPDIDVTTGLRFHPIEIVISMGIKIAAIMALGPPVLGVIVFEIILNATSMFNHGNIRIPVSTDRVLRLLVVTPDMHRVHHSVIARETNSNFGFNLPWWDRLFGTYRAQPERGHDGITIGLTEYREPRWLWLDRMLWIPFVNRKRAASVGGETGTSG